VCASVPTSYNNVVGASARLRRAPEYTARRLWWRVDGEDVVCQSKAESRSWLAPRRQPPNVICHRQTAFRPYEPGGGLSASQY
jgi:hypothetical protein